MRTLLHTVLAAIMLVGVAVAQQDEGTVQTAATNQAFQSTPGMDLSIHGRLQTIGFLQSLKDNFQDKTRVYLFLKQARLGVNGKYEDVGFDLQLAFGGEEEVKAPSPGVALSLLDLSVDVPLIESFYVKVGQYKVPYGREALTNSGFLQFNDRSIQYLGFKLGRDVGVAVHGKIDNFASAVGVFTGGGRDVPIRYIPQQLGFPMVVVRAGYTSLQEDMFNLKQAGYGLEGEGVAWFINGLYTEDSRVGHSTALNVKLSDKSLLLNSNWNPYIGRRPMERGKFWQVGTDFAFRTAMSGETFFVGEAEANFGVYSNVYGKIKLSGGRAQVGMYNHPFDVALRYAVLIPDKNFGYRSSLGSVYSIIDSKPIQELTLGATYFIKNERLKVGVDFPVLFGVPVVVEPNIGSYVLTEQPDQTSVLAPPTGGTIERQTVVEARMQLQFMF